MNDDWQKWQVAGSVQLSTFRVCIMLLRLLSCVAWASKYANFLNAPSMLCMFTAVFALLLQTVWKWQTVLKEELSLMASSKQSGIQLSSIKQRRENGRCSSELPLTCNSQEQVHSNNFL